MTSLEILYRPQNINVLTTNIEILHRTQHIIVSPTDNSVTIVNAGPIGPAGPPGPPGASSAYSHTQGVATTTWTITHNLGYKPAVSTFDSLNQEVEGDLVHINTNQCSVTFSYPISGSAFLS